MPFPNFPDKHAGEGIPNPGHNNNDDPLPENLILLYQSDPLNIIKDKLGRKVKKYKTKMDWLAEIYWTNNLVIAKSKGIGAPHATVLLEELIVRGVRRVINLGTCGGLRDYGIYLTTKSVRDEGVSHHYIAPEEFAYPDSALYLDLESALVEKAIDFKKAGNWTVDAVYRETLAEVEHYRSNGILTVDMETSAILSVSKFRGIQACAILVVSDLVEGNWDERRDKKVRYMEFEAMIDAALKVFTSSVE